MGTWTFARPRSTPGPFSRAFGPRSRASEPSRPPSDSRQIPRHASLYPLAGGRWWEGDAGQCLLHQGTVLRPHAPSCNARALDCRTGVGRIGVHRFLLYARQAHAIAMCNAAVKIRDLVVATQDRNHACQGQASGAILFHSTGLAGTWLTSSRASLATRPAHHRQ
jgi:hypothetical protein